MYKRWQHGTYELFQQMRLFHRVVVWILLKPLLLGNNLPYSVTVSLELLHHLHTQMNKKKQHINKATEPTAHTTASANLFNLSISHSASGKTQSPKQTASLLSETLNVHCIHIIFFHKLTYCSAIM